MAILLLRYAKEVKASNERVLESHPCSPLQVLGKDIFSQHRLLKLGFEQSIFCIFEDEQKDTRLPYDFNFYIDHIPHCNYS